ncbi:NAD(P)/FAD-dependent oxidoreductase [Kribbella speibonae]|uniref:NAD(P)/FAD-dependent oxidoreductase n=1 Tax=Kribbella speibonae TaxID=1572660 RepID=UPI001EDCE217|nr:FAD-dependent oxidoreductase [Kribbella speibonae]
MYWIEEAGKPATYEPLTESTNADLTIVGGGFLGLWSAVHAQRRNPGQRIVLLEAETIGWAASGRNGGMCSASLTHSDENGRRHWPDEYDQLVRLGEENFDEFESDVATFGIDCHWERTGGLSVAVEEYQLESLLSNKEYSGHVLDAEQIRSELNSPLFLGGVRSDPDEPGALVQPARLAQELARVATELGVQIHEGSRVVGLSTPRAGTATVSTERAVITTDRVLLATNAFRPLLRRNRLMTVPVYDHVLMTEPLTTDQMASIGWQGRQGWGDMPNFFAYSRLSKDNRILYGGIDAIYHAGRSVKEKYEDRQKSFNKLASHFFATFPQLEEVRFGHRWAGAIDTCTQFAAFYGIARHGRVAYAAGFTGLGVGATRFAANVLLDLLSGSDTERTGLKMVQKRPLPFPPEPLASIGINLTRWSLERADNRQGRRNAFLRALDAAGLGFAS